MRWPLLLTLLLLVVDPSSRVHAEPAHGDAERPAAAAAPPGSLKVKLRDKAGEPVPGVSVLVYDGNMWWAGKKERFESILGKTNAAGESVFEGFLSRLPERCSYRVEARRPAGATWRPPYVYAADGKQLGQDPLVNVAADPATGETTITFTLREHCPMDIKIIDPTSGKRLHLAQLLFRDDRVNDWTIAGLQDYGDDPGAHVLRPFTTFVAEMSNATFLATREGFYPHEFRLDKKLSPDKKISRTIPMTPAPQVELTIVDADGRPAVGARLKYLGPKPRGSYFPPKLTDEQGRTTIKYPAFGQRARYRVEHPAGGCEFKLADFPEAESARRAPPVAQPEKIRVRLRLEPPPANPAPASARPEARI